ncbi:hypothetical protein J6590_106776, partial [Homalodisca vitripennis]
MDRLTHFSNCTIVQEFIVSCNDLARRNCPQGTVDRLAHFSDCHFNYSICTVVPEIKSAVNRSCKTAIGLSGQSAVNRFARRELSSGDRLAHFSDCHFNYAICTVVPEIKQQLASVDRLTRSSDCTVVPEFIVSCKPILQDGNCPQGTVVPEFIVSCKPIYQDSNCPQWTGSLQTDSCAESQTDQNTTSVDRLTRYSDCTVVPEFIVSCKPILQDGNCPQGTEDRLAYFSGCHFNYSICAVMPEFIVSCKPILQDGNCPQLT